MKKKILSSIAAATALALSMSTAAFAEVYDEAGTEVEVAVQVVAAEIANVISVDISWDDLTFVYNAAGDAEWDSDALEYGEDGGSWEEAEKVLTATNYSNVAVDISAEVAMNDELTGEEDPIGDKVTLTTSVDDTPLNLDSVANGEVTEAPTGEITVTVEGNPANKEFEGTLATITLTIAPNEG